MRIRERYAMDPSTSKIELSYTLVPESRGEHVLLGRLLAKSNDAKHLLWDTITIETVVKHEGDEKIIVNTELDPQPDPVWGQVQT